MKYTIKTKKIGDSLWIRVPSDTRAMLNLEREGNEVVEVNIVKSEQQPSVDEPDTNFRCQLCNYDFDGNVSDEDLYCPFCGNEDRETIKEVEEIKHQPIIEEKE